MNLGGCGVPDIGPGPSLGVCVNYVVFIQNLQCFKMSFEVYWHPIGIEQFTFYKVVALCAFYACFARCCLVATICVLLGTSRFPLFCVSVFRLAEKSF